MINKILAHFRGGISLGKILLIYLLGVRGAIFINILFIALLQFYFAIFSPLILEITVLSLAAIWFAAIIVSWSIIWRNSRNKDNKILNFFARLWVCVEFAAAIYWAFLAG